MSVAMGIETSGEVSGTTLGGRERGRGRGRHGRHVLGRAARPVRCRFRLLVQEFGKRGVEWWGWWSRRFGRSDRGMTTSEYAMGTIAACAFAAVLYKVVNSAAVQDALQSLIKGALDGSF